MEDKIHILLVDDEPDYLELMAFWLKSKGYFVSAAPNGEKAIQIIKEENPHIIFLDINMPGIDGIETLRRIREFNQELPVIMVTAFPDEKKFSQTQKLNISGFFAKDAGFGELRNTIEVTLRTHKKLRPSSKSDDDNQT